VRLQSAQRVAQRTDESTDRVLPTGEVAAGRRTRGAQLLPGQVQQGPGVGTQRLLGEFGEGVPHPLGVGLGTRCQVLQGRSGGSELGTRGGGPRAGGTGGQQPTQRDPENEAQCHGDEQQRPEVSDGDGHGQIVTGPSDRMVRRGRPAVEAGPAG